MNYKAKLLRKEGIGYNRIKIISFKPEDTTLQINKDKTVPINLQFSHKEGNTLYIFIDMDTNEQIKFEKWNSGIDAEDIDTIVTKKLLTSLMIKIKQGTEMIDKSHILMYLLMVFAGVAIGTMVGVVIYPMIIPTPVISQPNIPSV